MGKRVVDGVRILWEPVLHRPLRVLLFPVADDLQPPSVESKALARSTSVMAIFR